MRDHLYGFQSEWQRSCPSSPKTIRLNLGTYSCVREDELMNSWDVCVEIEESLIPSLFLMSDLPIRINNPEIHELLISRPNVPSASHFGWDCLNILVEDFFSSAWHLNGKHVFRFEVRHMLLPLVHDGLLISFSVRNNYIRIVFLGITSLNFQSFIIEI
jgi:hypothetical protein